MSDPVTNMEIEDVLASIRRLVSEDTRPAPKAVDTLEKLVLTPALRVADDADQAKPLSLREVSIAEYVPQSEPTILANPIVEEAEEAPNARLETEQSTPAIDPNAPPEAIADQLMEAADQPVDFTALRDSPLHSRIAEMEAQIGATDDEWEPDDEDDGGNAGGDVAAMSWEDHAVLQTQDASEDEAGFVNVEDPVEPLQAVVETLHPVEEPAAGPTDLDKLETVEEGDTSSDEEPEVQSLNPLEAMAAAAETGFEQVIAQTVRETLADEMRDDTPEAQYDRFESTEETGVLDEQALREMVADIVRQELQGALGERITRNVRKLVRREIQRALTTQELQ